MKLIFALLLVSLLAAPLAVHAEEKAKALTLMVYMCGSDLESQHGAASADILEMIGSGYSRNDVDLLIMTGGSSVWTLGMPSDSLCVYTPARKSVRMVQAFEDSSMGAPSALSSFLNYAVENHPAEKYALILWNHGAGPVLGVCSDEKYDSDYLTLPELYQALLKSPFADRKLSWIGFDACLMGNAESAAMLSPFAEYMIASEETEPSSGWNYSFLKGIETDADGAAAGRRIVDAYFEDAGPNDSRTLACIDLSRMSPVTEAMDRFYSVFQVTGANYAACAFHVRNSEKFGQAALSSGSADLVDLYSFLSGYSDLYPDETSRLLEALDDAIVYSRSLRPDAHGLSVYHPYFNKPAYLSASSAVYPQLRFSEGYQNYVASFAGYLFGKTSLSWKGIAAVRAAGEHIYALPLSEEQVHSVASCSLLLLRRDAGGAYTAVSVSGGISASENTFTSPLECRTLSLLDASGNVLANNVPYSADQNNRLLVYLNYTKEGFADSQEASVIPDSRNSGAKYKDPYADLTPVRPESISSSQSLNPAGTGSSGGSGYHSGYKVDITPVVPGSIGSDQSINPPEWSGSKGYPSIAVSPLSTISSENFSQSVLEIQAVDAATLDKNVQKADVVHVCLVLDPQEDGNYAVSETLVYDSVTKEWSSRSSFHSEDYAWTVIPTVWRMPAETGDGLGGYASWEESYITVQTVPAAGSAVSAALSLAELPDNAFVSFQLTDIQNNGISSVPLRVN